MADNQTTDYAAVAKKLTRDLIDIGARCQKAGSFCVAELGAPSISVYDAVAPEVERYLREQFRV